MIALSRNIPFGVTFRTDPTTSEEVPKLRWPCVKPVPRRHQETTREDFHLVVPSCSTERFVRDLLDSTPSTKTFYRAKRRRRRQIGA